MGLDMVWVDWHTVLGICHTMNLLMQDECAVSINVETRKMPRNDLIRPIMRPMLTGFPTCAALS